MPVPVARRLAARPVSSVAEPVGAQRRGVVEAGEESVAQPLVDERGDADMLDAIGEAFVGGAACCTVVAVVDTGGGADQDEALDSLGVGERCVERHTPAHRVPDVGPGTADVDQSVRALPQITVGWGRGVTMARKVDGDRDRADVEVGQFRAQQPSDEPPRPGGLGEAVRQDEML